MNTAHVTSRRRRWWSGELAAAGLGLVLVALAGCPPRTNGGPRARPTVTATELLADVQALGPRLREAKVADPDRVLEAYLAFFRGEKSACHLALCGWLARTKLTAARAAARLSLIPSPSPQRMRAFLARLLVEQPCAEKPAVVRRPAGPRFQPGVYRHAVKLTTAAGETMRLAERWVIERDGAKLRGLLVRRLRRQRADGGTYDCNGKDRFETISAAALEGEIAAAGIALREVTLFTRPNACQPRGRRRRCRATVTAQGGLTLRCPAVVELARVGPLPTASAKAGIYRWTGTTPLAGGNRQEVSEQWHLVRRAGGVVEGFYLRDLVGVARSGSTFSCNSRARYRLQRLYLLVGKIGPGGATLTEKVALSQSHPCDKGAGKLDSYRGVFGPAKLTLQFAGGSQVLERIAGRSPWPAALPAVP